MSPRVHWSDSLVILSAASQLELLLCLRVVRNNNSGEKKERRLGNNVCCMTDTGLSNGIKLQCPLDPLTFAGWETGRRKMVPVHRRPHSEPLLLPLVSPPCLPGLVTCSKPRPRLSPPHTHTHRQREAPRDTERKEDDDNHKRGTVDQNTRLLLMREPFFFFLEAES